MIKGGKNSKKTVRAHKRSNFLMYVPDKFKYFYARRKKTTILVSIVLVCLLIYGGLIFGEFLQFKRVESKINKMNTLALEEFGPAFNQHIGGSCGYASAKFHKGDLGCGYSFSMTFHEPDLEKANQIANRFDAFLKKNQDIFKIKYESDQGLIDLSKTNSIGFVGEKDYDFSDGYLGVGCSGGIDYASQKETFGFNSTEKSDKIKEYVGFGIHCGKSPSLVKHYPVQE